MGVDGGVIDAARVGRQPVREEREPPIRVGVRAYAGDGAEAHAAAGPVQLQVVAGEAGGRGCDDPAEEPLQEEVLLGWLNHSDFVGEGFLRYGIGRARLRGPGC